MPRPAIPFARGKALHLGGVAVEIGLEDRRTQAWGNLMHAIAPTAQRPGEHDFAGGAGIPDPVRLAASADQIAPPVEFERIHRQRDRPAALSPTDLEDTEVAADQADPNEKREHAADEALKRGRLEIARRIPGHQSF